MTTRREGTIYKPVLAIALLCAITASAAERPFRPTNGHGRVEGRLLLNGATPAATRKSAKVVLRSATTTTGYGYYEVEADPDGHFVIENVVADRYLATAESADWNYVPEAYWRRPCYRDFDVYCPRKEELEKLEVRAGQTAWLDFDLAKRIVLTNSTALFDGTNPRQPLTRIPMLPGRYRYTYDQALYNTILERGYDPDLDDLPVIDLTAGQNTLPAPPPSGPQRGIALTLTFPPSTVPSSLGSVSATVNLYDEAGHLVRSAVARTEDRSPVRVVFSPLPAGQPFYVRTESYGLPRDLTHDTVVDQIYPGIDCPGQACDLSLGTPVVVPTGEQVIELTMPTRLGACIRWIFRERSTGERVDHVPVGMVISAAGETVAFGNLDALGTYGLPGGAYYLRTYVAGANPFGIPQEWPVTHYRYFDRVHGGSECQGQRCSFEGATLVQVPEGEDQPIEVEFLLDRGFIVYGDVRDAATERPVAGARVRLRDAAGEELGVYEASVNGRFRTGALRRGRYRLETTDNGEYLDVYGDSSLCPMEGCLPTGGPTMIFSGRKDQRAPVLWLSTAQPGQSH